MRREPSPVEVQTQRASTPRRHRRARAYAVRVRRLSLTGVPAHEQRAVLTAFDAELTRLLARGDRTARAPRPGTPAHVGESVARAVHQRIEERERR